jgi:hypothetical protein
MESIGQQKRLVVLVSRALLVGLTVLGLQSIGSAVPPAAGADGVTTVSLSVAVNWGDVTLTAQPFQMRVLCDPSATMFGFPLNADTYQSTKAAPYEFYPGFAPMVFPIEIGGTAQCRMFLGLRNNIDKTQFDVQINGSPTAPLAKDGSQYVDFSLAADTSVAISVKNARAEKRAIVDAKASVYTTIRVDSGQGAVYTADQPICDGSVLKGSGFRQFAAPSSFWLNYFTNGGSCTFVFTSAIPDFANKLVVYVNGSLVAPTASPTGVTVPVVMSNPVVRVHTILKSPTPVLPSAPVAGSVTTKVALGAPSSAVAGTEIPTTTTAAKPAAKPTKSAKGVKTTTTKPQKGAPKISKVQLTMSANYAEGIDSRVPLNAKLNCPSGRMFGRRLSDRALVPLPLYQGDKYNVEIELIVGTECKIELSQKVSAVTVNGTPVPADSPIVLPMKSDTVVAIEVPPPSVPFAFEAPIGYKNLRTEVTVNGFDRKDAFTVSLGRCVDVSGVDGQPYADQIVYAIGPSGSEIRPPRESVGRTGSSCVLTVKGEGFDIAPRLALLLNGVPQAITSTPEGVSLVVPFEDHVNVQGFIRPEVADEVFIPSVPSVSSRPQKTPKSGPKAGNAKVDKDGCISSVAKSKNGKLVAVAKICPR